MKKIILSLVLLFVSISAVQAQSFQGAGKHDLSVGLASGFNGYDNLGVQANYNIGINSFFSAGAQANLLFSDFFALYVGGRANFHILNAIDPGTTSPFDVYISATLGVKFSEVKTKFDVGGYVGAKYDISNRFGVKLEVGSNVMAGVFWKL